MFLSDPAIVFDFDGLTITLCTYGWQYFANENLEKNIVCDMLAKGSSSLLSELGKACLRSLS